ncbi:MAG TPA: aminotransferase class I/II-fold pyridoxal phosphate-dependent enzyme [Puia sp.]|nr:aminotransferase class I/II-fold pyridoxal phosphate-dependent enzyme [Puia sp.]
MIQGHGDDGYRYKEPIRADFSSNVRYGELDAELERHLRERIGDVTHYPDPGGERLQQLAANAWGVDPDQVLVTNGAIEAIYLVAQMFRASVSSNPSSTIFTPAFSEYEDACRLQGMDIHLLPWDGLFTQVPAPLGLAPYRLAAPGLVFIGNPNNPTGRALPAEVLKKLVYENPHCFFIIDESYIEFTVATKSLLPLLGSYPNCILLRSLTKSCRIPGLRLGFVIADSGIVNILRRYKIPWSVNRLAIEAGMFIFNHPSRFSVSPDPLLAATAIWRRQLQEATGWVIHPSDTHYFLVEISGAAAPPFTAAALKEWLVRQHGLLIRDAANFHGLGPYHFRVACQSPGYNQLLTDALRQCINTGI